MPESLVFGIWSWTAIIDCVVATRYCTICGEMGLLRKMYKASKSDIVRSKDWNMESSVQFFVVDRRKVNLTSFSRCS